MEQLSVASMNPFYLGKPALKGLTGEEEEEEQKELLSLLLFDFRNNLLYRGLSVCSTPSDFYSFLHPGVHPVLVFLMPRELTQASSDTQPRTDTLSHTQTRRERNTTTKFIKSFLILSGSFPVCPLV